MATITYDTFLDAAKKAGMLESFSTEELEVAKRAPEYGLSALTLKQDALKATTTEQKLLASEAEKQLRSVYGLADPTATASSAVPMAENATTIKVPKTSTAAGSNTATSFTGTAYQQAVQEADSGSQDGFYYNPEQDDIYLQMRKEAIREADRAREDTLAKASAATGGVASSYAIAAAQQAGDYTLQGLSAQIPELRETAHQRYLEQLALGGAAGKTGSTGSGGGGFDNGKRTEAQVVEMQKALGVTPDGKWGPQSSAAAGDRSADEAWELYQSLGGFNTPTTPTTGKSVGYKKLNTAAMNMLSGGRSLEDVRSYLTSVAPGEGVSQEEVDEILARLSSVGNTGNSGTGSSGTGGSSSIFTKMADSVVQATSPFAGSTENARSLVSWLPSEAQFNANSDKYTVHGEKFTDYKDYILAFIDEEIRSGLTDAEAVWLLDYYGL